jgi:hypothetical protein
MKVGAVIGQASAPGWLVSEIPKPGRRAPVGVRGRGLEGLGLGRDELAILVLELGDGIAFCLA